MNHISEPNDVGWRKLLDAMVDKLKTDGVLRSHRVELAMRTVPRHEFLVDDCDVEEAYTGDVVRILADAQGGTLSTASHVAAVARMLEVLDAQPGEHVLEIGLGTGYNAALLAHMVGATGHVTAIDNEATLVRSAERNLNRLQLTNVTSIVRDGWLGDESNAPYDALIATVGLSDLSPHWIAQLRDGGRLVVPMWLSTIAQPGVIFTKHGDRLEGRVFSNPSFIMLKGRGEDDLGGWVLVDDTFWTVRDASRTTWETLKQLLSKPPIATTELPELDRMWSYWLGLEDPHVVMAYLQDEARTIQLGLFDPDLPGMAVVEGKARTVRGYGDRATMDRLIDLVIQRRPRSPETLKDRRIVDLLVDAVPHGQATRPTGGWLFERQHYDFVVTAPS